MGFGFLSNHISLHIYGKHTVDAFIKQKSSGYKVEKVWLDERKYNDKNLDFLRKSLGKSTPIAKMTPELKQSVAGDSQAQGWVAKVLMPTFSSSDLPHLLPGSTQCLLLDHLQDPHNVGACIRSACAFGVKVIVMPKFSACPINSTVAKVAAGALAHVKIVMANINQAVQVVQKEGFWVVASSEHASMELSSQQVPTPVAWVVGNEHKGISASVIKRSDLQIRLPTEPDFPSLNVSVATGILLAYGRQKA